MNERTQTRTIGRGMMFAGWIVLLILLTLLFNNWLDRQHNPNDKVLTETTAGGMIEVVLDRNRMGHYLASGEINGQPVTFLLDTGATDISIPAFLADRLGLEKGAPRRYQTANGTITTYGTRLASVRLGGIERHNVRAHINPGMRQGEVLLGMSFLKHLELVQRGKRLTLRQYPGQ